MNEKNVYSISIETSRDGVETEVDKPFSARYEDSSIYEEAYLINFHLTLRRNRKTAIEAFGTIVDKDRILEDECNTLEIADDFSADLGSAYAAITDLWPEEKIDLEYAAEALFDCYIESFYLSPDSKDANLENWFFGSLSEILRYLINTRIQYIAYSPVPQEFKQNDDADELKPYRTKKEMEETLKSNGYQESQGVFIKNCAYTGIDDVE